jgi:hypothetical protein
MVSRDGFLLEQKVRYTVPGTPGPRNSSKFFVRIDPEDDTMFAEYHPSVARRQLLKIDPRP